MSKKTEDVEKKKTTTKKIETKKDTKKAKKKDTTKKTATKKKATKKTTAKKSTSKKSAKNEAEPKNFIKPLFQAEYYDFPNSYNKTVVKILAQTPKMLFVYWEISEDDRQNFIKTYGEDFFERTKPVLILYNDTLNYSFEVEINDFANSWYVHVNDSNCNYRAELGRKSIPNFVKENNKLEKVEHNTQTQQKQSYIPYYIYISSSNEISSPNDRVLFTKRKTLTFRNIKTGKIVEKNIMKFITNYGVFTMQELYRHLYPEENFEYEKFLKNPSSGSTSSMRISSQFK